MMTIADPWAAYQFDNAVSLMGNAIEGAAQELEKVGSGDDAKFEPKYSMDQLLDPDFRLPVKSKEPEPQPMRIPLGIQGFGYERIG